MKFGGREFMVFWRFGSWLEELEGKEGVKKIQLCCRKAIGLDEFRAKNILRPTLAESVTLQAEKSF